MTSIWIIMQNVYKCMKSSVLVVVRSPPRSCVCSPGSPSCSSGSDRRPIYAAPSTANTLAVCGWSIVTGKMSKTTGSHSRPIVRNRCTCPTSRPVIVCRARNESWSAESGVNFGALDIVCVCLWMCACGKF